MIYVELKQPAGHHVPWVVVRFISQVQKFWHSANAMQRILGHDQPFHYFQALHFYQLILVHHDGHHQTFSTKSKFCPLHLQLTYTTDYNIL